MAVYRPMIKIVRFTLTVYKERKVSEVLSLYTVSDEEMVSFMSSHSFLLGYVSCLI